MCNDALEITEPGGQCLCPAPTFDNLLPHHEQREGEGQLTMKHGTNIDFHAVLNAAPTAKL